MCSFSAPLGSGDRSFLGIDPVCDYQLPYGLTLFTGGVDSDLCGNDPGSCRSVPGIPFTRKCVAEPQPWRRFVCYDFDPDVNPNELLEEYITVSDDLTSAGISPIHVVTKAYGFRALGSPLFSNTTDTLSDMIQFGVFADWEEFEEEWEFDQRFPPEHPGFPDCLGGCAFHEFCGRDGVCHVNNCANKYEYAPYEMVNYNATFPKNELVCTDGELQTIGAGVECAGNARTEWPIATFFQCQVADVLDPDVNLNMIDFAQDSCWTPDLDDRYVAFDRMCTAKNAEQEFECYELIDPLASGQDYIQAVSSFESQCSADTLNTDYRDAVFAGQQNVLATADDSLLRFDGRSVYSSCSRDLVFESKGRISSQGFCDIYAGAFCPHKVETVRLAYLTYSQVKLTRPTSAPTAELSNSPSFAPANIESMSSPTSAPSSSTRSSPTVGPSSSASSAPSSTPLRGMSSSTSGPTISPTSVSTIDRPSPSFPSSAGASAKVLMSAAVVAVGTLLLLM